MSVPYPSAEDRSGVSLRQKKNRRQALQGDPFANGGRDPRPQLPPPQGSQGSGISQVSQYTGRPSQESSRSEARPRPRQKGNENTSNLVKKRYSVRYGQAPDASQGAPPLPGVPRVPQNFLQANGSSTSLGHHRKKSSVDVRALRNPNLQPGQCTTQYFHVASALLTLLDLADFLANASEQDVANYQGELKSLKNRASQDLQRNVKQNRTQFIKISKEAEKLKGEMQTLQGLMNDLTITLDQAAATNGSQRDDAVRKRNNRSSVANVEAMWSTQIQALWKTIEGSQKFVAATPGRHVLLEQRDWIELDAATWKAKKAVGFVLLNDNLLVAARKTKRIDPNLIKQGHKPPTKFVAEQCFPLQEIDIMDLSSGGRARNQQQQQQQLSGAISVRYGAESFTYRKPEGSINDFMLAFKRAVDELRRKEQAETEASNVKTQDSVNYLAVRDAAVSANQGLMRSLSNSKDRPVLLVDAEGKQRDMRWVESQIDELDIHIALQHFEEAVKGIESLREVAKSIKSNSVAQELVNAKLIERTAKLAGNYHPVTSSAFVRVLRTIPHFHRSLHTCGCEASLPHYLVIMIINHAPYNVQPHPYLLYHCRSLSAPSPSPVLHPAP